MRYNFFNIYFYRSKVGTVELKSTRVVAIANPVWLAAVILARTAVNAFRLGVGVVEEGVECRPNSSSSNKHILAYVRWDIQAKTVR